MLMPKRAKYRKVQRGRMTGAVHEFGDELKVHPTIAVQEFSSS